MGRTRSAVGVGTDLEVCPAPAMTVSMYFLNDHKAGAEEWHDLYPSFQAGVLVWSWAPQPLQ